MLKEIIILCDITERDHGNEIHDYGSRSEERVWLYEDSFHNTILNLNLLVIFVMQSVLVTFMNG